ncbi:MAG: ATP-binding protein [Lachnospiraceae bacterium]|nr:ATP-binding protein [Lachnospiraceae bacterium]
MLLDFQFNNYRSFRDGTILSMEAKGNAEYRSCLIPYKKTGVLPSAAIFGKNGGGKSNIIRAFWLGVQFIRNAQKTQHEKAPVPVRAFALNDYSGNEPTGFEYQYLTDGIKYTYGFSATTKEIISEYLYASPKGQKSVIFSRAKQQFTFPANGEKKKKEMIAEAVGSNQLFFSIACVMNYQPCIAAMKWFREDIYFSKDYTDIPKQLLEYAEDSNMLQAIVTYAKQADVGIEDMTFEVSNEDISRIDPASGNIPEGIIRALKEFAAALKDSSDTAELNLRVGEVKTSSMHRGVKKDGKSDMFSLELADESDGTRRLMALAPGVERVLKNGGIFLVDEIDRELHPLLAEFVISKFQSAESNPGHAQLIFTTHDTELLNMEILRKDQVYFVDKDRESGVSELFNLTELPVRTNDNIRKAYLAGKYGAVPDVDTVEVE